MRPSRFTTFAVCIVALLVSLIWVGRSPTANVVAIIAALLVILGIIDLIQTRHSIQRNYPVIGHMRWLFEMIRPELRQYLFEDEDDAAPFSRAQRSLVYARAKKETADHPFGTLVDVYANGYEFIGHSARPAEPGKPEEYRVTVGNEQCARPYSASIFNISAMSFGSLGAAAIRALNKGARLGNFSHDTGEGSISSYHREAGGDIIWEIASGYFGCRTEDGKFDPDKFAKQAAADQVKMIEIKMSQGAKPGHGGILPGPKVTPEIAETRGVPVGKDCISPSSHSAFSTPLEMMGFISELRRLSGGKPVGFKLCIGHPWEFMGIVKAMLETKVYPDFIVVDGGEGGTGAAPLEFTDHLGMPMQESLLFVHNTLVGAGVRKHIKLGAAGKIISAFDIARVLALGADWCNAGRGFMFAIGCVQSLSCHTNRCPTGVATQDTSRQRALVVEDKAERVANFHKNTLHALSDMLAAAGLRRPGELGPHHVLRRVSANEVRPFSAIYPFLLPAELLQGSKNEYYAAGWTIARADSFDALKTEVAA